MIHSIVVKSVRACNLRCPYCYYINEQTIDYGKIITTETISSLYKSVADYLASNAGKEDGFSLIWHGGEPLLMGRKRFQTFLDLQAQHFPPGQVRNSLQTNGVLIDQAWIDFFKKNKVGVGISLDTSPEAHNKNRVTVRGTGTYSQVVKAIKLFRENGIPVGTLSVVDGTFDGSEAINNLEMLEIPACDFLIPMSNNALEASTGLVVYKEYTDFHRIGQFLTRAFHKWADSSPPKLTVRLFMSLFGNAFGYNSAYLPTGSSNLADVVVMETDGEFCLDPDFWHIDRYGLGEHYKLPFNVHDHGFSLEAVERNITEFARSHSLDAIPDDCQKCKVRSLCRGAHPASRFGPDGSFNHRSAWCEAMYALSDAMLQFIVDRGFADSLYDDDLKEHIRRQHQEAAAVV